jgi:VWFA-related protein
VMIASWDPSLQIRLDFTNDVAAANRVISELASRTGLGGQSDFERRRLMEELNQIPEDWKLSHVGESQPTKPPLDMAMAPARVFAAKMQHEQREVVQALKSVMLAMRGVEGRKALVFLSGRLDENPGAPIFEFVDHLKDQFEGGQNFNYTSEAHEFRDPELVPSLTKAANSTGVTFYPIHAGGAGFETEFRAADVSGAYAYQTSGGIATPMVTSYATMNVLAAATGGSALTGSSNFKLALDTIANDLTTYYSLGFRTDEQRTDSIRKLDVRLKNPRGLNVRMRHEFVEKSLMSELNDAVAANLAYPIARNDLGVKAVAGTSQSAPDNHLTVPLDIKVPTSTLTLVPDGSDLVGRFSTFIAFGRGDGTVSKVVRQEQNLRFPADSLQRRKEVTVRTALTIDAKTETVSVGVLDEISHLTGFAAVKLLAPSIPAPAMSPIVPVSSSGSEKGGN